MVVGPAQTPPRMRNTPALSRTLAMPRAPRHAATGHAGIPKHQQRQEIAHQRHPEIIKHTPGTSTVGVRAPHSPWSLAHTDHGTRAARSNARCNRRRTKREVGECKAAAGGRSGEGKVSQRRGGWAGWRRTGGSAGQEVHKSQDWGKWTRAAACAAAAAGRAADVEPASWAPAARAAPAASLGVDARQPDELMRKGCS